MNLAVSQIALPEMDRGHALQVVASVLKPSVPPKLATQALEMMETKSIA